MVESAKFQTWTHKTNILFGKPQSRQSKPSKLSLDLSVAKQYQTETVFMSGHPLDCRIYHCKPFLGHNDFAQFTTSLLP